jgi:DNA end-binding protein Ku
MASPVWKGFTSFGLVSFPVRLSAAARADPVRFHMLHRKDLSRIKEVFYCAEEDKPVERSEIVKGFESAKGEYVTVDDEELKKIAPPTATSMDILQTVAQGAVDPIFFETSYYVAPDEHAGKAYSLFHAALLATGQDAIAKLAMHNREHIVLIRPDKNGLVLHTLYYPNELHRANRVEASAAKYTSKELELAKSLLAKLKAPFKPDQFKDAYRENVEHLIAAKRKGRPMAAVAQPRRAKVVDLMDALKRSLESPRAGRKAAKRSRAA